MILHKREIQNYEPAEVEGYLADALALVEKLEPSDDLRGHLFNQACALLSGKQILVEQQAPTAMGMALPKLG